MSGLLPVNPTTTSTRLTALPFGLTPQGEEVLHFTLENTEGLRVGVTNFGGILTHLETPDREGKRGDILLGHHELRPYLKNSPYFGALIGRFGNRIAGGKFELDGKTYSLALNNAPNGVDCHLHGGTKGWDKVVWGSLATIENGVPTLVLTHHSPDGDEGYPGAVDVMVTYRLLPDALEIAYEATTTAATPLNLTNHAYFNLSGIEGTPITDHELQMPCEHFVPVKAGSIPLGELRPVANTPFDFTSPKRIGSDIDAADEQIELGAGYDHTFVRATEPSKEPALIAEVFEPKSGRVMQTLTTEPGVQLYTGNFLDDTEPNKSGGTYSYRSGFCLETQHFPDSPNQPNFPSTILRPGETFRSTTVYRFSTR
jgi:aldose 1-epimerase